MRKLFGIPILLALSACGGPAANDASAPEGTDFVPEMRPGQIVSCNDGDTCKARLDGDEEITKIRLAGIDAPETSGGADGQGQPLGREAKEFLNERLRGKSVRIYKTDTDMYGRTVAEIRLGNKLVNLELVRLGYVEAYKRASHVDRGMYRAAEAEAKAGKRGIWSLPDYKSPSDFRREERERLGQTASAEADAG